MTFVDVDICHRMASNAKIVPRDFLLKVKNFNIAEKVRASTENVLESFVNFWHFPSNGVRAKIVLRNLDLPFEGEQLKILTPKQRENAQNNCYTFGYFPSNNTISNVTPNVLDLLFQGQTFDILVSRKQCQLKSALFGGCICTLKNNSDSPTKFSAKSSASFAFDFEVQLSEFRSFQLLHNC